MENKNVANKLGHTQIFLFLFLKALDYIDYNEKKQLRTLRVNCQEYHKKPIEIELLATSITVYRISN